MAYNRTFNPDALPAFAEPERKQVPTPASSSSNHAPPRGSSAASHAGPSHQYKPPPPLPQTHTDSCSRQHAAPQHPVNQAHRQESYGQPSTQIGRYGTPVGSLGQPHGPGPQGRDYAFATTSPPPGPGNGRPPQGVAIGGQAGPRPGGRPPPTPAPQGNVDPTLLPLFRAVDKNGSGQLSERELGAALVNGDWSPFDPHTIRLMIRMFDSDRSGFIGYEEFCGLWSFLASWRTLFDRFDVDRSGNISLDEFKAALDAFGYRLSDNFVRFLFGTYDRGSGSLSFDLFVQACIGLKRMTDVFKRYDDDRDGFITLSFEDFLSEILRQR